MFDIPSDFDQKRAACINGITRCLGWLASNVRIQNSVNLTSENLHAEYFYRDFLNAVYSVNLTNANQLVSNSPGLDLIDLANHLIVQVTAQDKLAKVRESLNQLAGRFDEQMKFWFVSISDRLPNWIAKQFLVPPNIFFDPSTNVFDNQRLVHDCMDLDNYRLQQAYTACLDHYGKQNDTCFQLTQAHLDAFVNNVTYVKRFLGQLPSHCEAYVEENDIYRIHAIHGLLSKTMTEVLSNAYEDLERLKHDVWFNWELLNVIQNLEHTYLQISYECEKNHPSFINVQNVFNALKNLDFNIISAANIFSHTFQIESDLIINRIDM